MRKTIKTKKNNKKIVLQGEAEYRNVINIDFSMTELNNALRKLFCQVKPETGPKNADPDKPDRKVTKR